MCRLTTCHNSLVIGSKVRRPAGLELKQLPQFHLQRLGSMAMEGERLSHWIRSALTVPNHVSRRCTESSVQRCLAAGRARACQPASVWQRPANKRTMRDIGRDVTSQWPLEAKSGDQQAPGRTHLCAGLPHATIHV